VDVKQLELVQLREQLAGVQHQLAAAQEVTMTALQETLLTFLVLIG